jgi:hypothetical protein
MTRAIDQWLCAAGIVAASLAGARVAQSQEPSPQQPSETRTAPNYAFWAGTRGGIFIPYGALYADRAFVTTPFEDVASAGPAIEVDIGARFVRRFVGYAYLEQTFLGRGTSAAWTVPHGGQSAPSTQALGIGLRWESNPDGLGIVADLAVAHRWFTSRWADGTTVRMDGPADVRLGLGAGWRITSRVTLASLMTVFSGAFSNRTLDGQKLGESTGSYSALALTLSGHVDVD